VNIGFLYLCPRGSLPDKIGQIPVFKGIWQLDPYCKGEKDCEGRLIKPSYRALQGLLKSQGEFFCEQRTRNYGVPSALPEISCRFCPRKPSLQQHLSLMEDVFPVLQPSGLAMSSPLDIKVAICCILPTRFIESY
jgi:hypothetical protein